MATRTPGASPSFPTGQKRQQFGRDWGNYVSPATLPNAAGNALTTTEFKLEAGDRAYLVISGTNGQEYLCVSAGTAGGGNAVWVVNTGGLGPWSNVLYVDNVRGSDVTGTRGDDNAPFATIQAALNAAQDSDNISPGPQVFNLTTSLTRPATLTSFTVSGYAVGAFDGSGTTVLQQNTPGQAVFDLSVNLGLVTCVLRNMTLVGAGVNDPIITADGSAYTPGFYLPVLEIINCDLALGTVVLKYVGEVDVFGGAWSGNLLSVTSCGLIELYGVRAPDIAVMNSFDADDPKAAFFGWGVEVRQSSLLGGFSNSSFVTLSKQAHLVVDQTSLIGGLKGSGLTVNAGATAGPSVQCNGYIAASNGGIVDFASAGSELPDTALALTIDFRGTSFWGASAFIGQTAATTAQFKVGGAAAHSQSVKLEAASARPDFTVIADANVALTSRGAFLPSASYKTPGATGSIIPTQLVGTIDLSAGGAVAKTWNQLGYTGLVRTGVAPDAALATQSAKASDVAITAKTTTGLTFDSNTVAGNTACSWMAVWR